MTKTVDGSERGTLSQRRLARKEPFDVPSVLLVAIFDKLRRRVLLLLTRLACYLVLLSVVVIIIIIVILRLSFRVRTCRSLMATTTTTGLSLLLKQLRSTFSFEVERSLLKLFDDGQRSLEIG
jgi:branched-subunit amino acid ABC-type transport system permease component